MTTSRTGPRWLVLIHQLPARPSNNRVTIWRRLQSLGAIALRSSVYVLPNNTETQEDFEWLRTEIVGLGGTATVMATSVVSSHSARALVEQFREQSRREYAELVRQIQHYVKRRRSANRRAAPRFARREAQAIHDRYSRIAARDYFHADNAREAAALVRKLETTASDTNPRKARPPARRTAYRGVTWVTRARPGIDRMASAWFIRKFVDPKARFAFVDSGQTAPPNSVPFDMFGAEFGHHGSHCTLETLIERFAITDSATIRLSQVVHDLDLKDSKYGGSECVAVARLVDGLRQLYRDDGELLAQGMIMMEALHRSF